MIDKLLIGKTYIIKRGSVGSTKARLEEVRVRPALRSGGRSATHYIFRNLPTNRLITLKSKAKILREATE